MANKKSSKKSKKSKSNIPDTMKLINERDIALDFAGKVYKKFEELVKSIILFGSSAKKVSTPESDIDIIVIIDDVSVKWDQELIAWYREELGKLIRLNPYNKSLHVNSVKLSTWWNDLFRGDPVIINVLRYGEVLIDHGGFFAPLQLLLKEGRIRSTPEAVYTLLQRAPNHMARTRASLLSAVDGLYWACIDSAHAALIAANVIPPSPEHIPGNLYENFVKTKMLKERYVEDYKKIHEIAKDIVHGKKIQISGEEIDFWIKRADEFVKIMTELVDKLIEKNK